MVKRWLLANLKLALLIYNQIKIFLLVPGQASVNIFNHHVEINKKYRKVTGSYIYR